MTLREELEAKAKWTMMAGGARTLTVDDALAVFADWLESEVEKVETLGMDPWYEGYDAACEHFADLAQSLRKDKP